MSDREHEIGAGPTATPPQRQQSGSPGSLEPYGPAWVGFVTERFQALEVAMAGILDVLRLRPQEGFRVVASGQTDGSGNARIPLFNTAPGQSFALHRLYVHAEGFNFTAPYNGGSGRIEIGIGPQGALSTQGSVEAWDGASLVANAAGGTSLPTVFTASRLQAIEAQDGEVLAVNITGGPTNTRIECRAMGVLGTIYSDLG